MKLIIGGSTGFVGTELVRQALSNSEITSVIGLSRRETTVPTGCEDKAGKLKSVICDDFENYSDSLRKEMEDADACIWTIAVTPSKLKELTWDETCKICRDYTYTAIEALAEIPRKQTAPLRFTYISGHFTSRPGDADRTESIAALEDHGLTGMAHMRGDVEAHLLEVAQASDSKLEVNVAKPGFILAPGRIMPPVPGLPKIELRTISAALLDQTVKGFEKETLSNDDMIRLGEQALAKTG